MPHKDKQEYNNYMKKYMLVRYHRRKAQGIKFLGGKCVDCETQESLEFDHKDPDNKEFTITKLWSASEEKFWDEIKKCVLRCTKCHIKKTRKENKIRRPWRHGTFWSFMEKKCKCLICTEFKQKYYIKRNKQRRLKRLMDRKL